MIVSVVSVVPELVVEVVVHKLVPNSSVVNSSTALDNSFVNTQLADIHPVGYSLYSSMMQTSKLASGSLSNHYLNTHFPKNCYSTSSGSVDDNFPSSLCCMAS